MELLGDLRSRFVAVAQLDLDACDEGSVDPVLGGRAAGLTNDGAEIALGEAHAGGVIADLVLFAAMLVDELDETVEDGLLARTGQGLPVRLAAEQMVAVLHQGAYEGRHGGQVVVGLMREIPNAFEDIVSYFQFGAAHRELEIAHLPVEGRRPLARGKGHGKGGEESDAVDFQVFAKTERTDDGAGAKIDQRRRADVMVHQIEIDVTFAADNNAEAVVIDDERRLLLHDEAEGLRRTIEHSERRTEVDMLAQVLQMRAQDVLDAGQIH